MSGNSYNSDCPCCLTEGTLECQTDHRPHDGVSGTCVQCGYQYFTELGFVDKETLDELRADYEYTPKPMTDEMKKNIADYRQDNDISTKKQMTIREGRNLLIGWMIGMLMITIIFALKGVI